MTLTLFPLLFLTLELPKRIINDAIGASSDEINFIGVEVGQIPFLMILCGAFLLSVFGHGIMKMRINTMKGILAERLLRRLRYTLIARILRFPAPYFERTSQGELVSMVTSESEPMGGLMGDAVAQPVLQAGQMLTILVFLFMQSIAFGLAACAGMVDPQIAKTDQSVEQKTGDPNSRSGCGDRRGGGRCQHPENQWRLALPSGVDFGSFGAAFCNPL